MTEPEFARLQRAFARHLRDPERVPAPDLPADRLEVYRYAVYFNIERFMADNFPRIKAILPVPRWEAMVRDYLVRQPARTPVFARLPTEFLTYLEHVRRDPLDPPYLYELAHFDWLENLVCTDEREPDLTGVDRGGDLLAGEIVVNPVHCVQAYRFPVHAIDATFRPEAVPDRATHLIAFRDCGHAYGIMDLNAVSRELFLAVRDDPTTPAAQVLEGIASRIGTANLSAVLAGGRDILERMRDRELILGTRDRAH
ncbi:MAG: DUF2063 domain-containing protein [Gammaproteobacteria bacterium]